MGVSLLSLWAPILLGTLLAWVASALIHMLLKYHNADHRALPNEAEVAAAIAAGRPSPGIHTLPHCSDMKQMGDPALQQRFRDGPVAVVTVMRPGLPAMGKLMLQQILYFLFGTALVGFCATLALPPGASYLVVFHFVAVVGFLAFGWAVIPYSIWYGHPWATSARYLLDGLIYALVIAGCYGWLWPSAA